GIRDLTVTGVQTCALPICPLMPQAALRAEEPVKKPGITGTPVPLGTRAEIYPSSPLPELNSPGALAFAARLKGDASSDLVAYIRSEERRVGKEWIYQWSAL